MWFRTRKFFGTSHWTHLLHAGDQPRRLVFVQLALEKPFAASSSKNIFVVPGHRADVLPWYVAHASFLLWTLEHIC